MKTLDEKELVELDAWIAEHVFGQAQMFGIKKRGYWYLPDAHGYTNRQSEAWRLTLEEAKKHECPHGGRDERVTVCEIDTPRYSTNPAAAMQVLEKCLEKAGCDVTFFKSTDKLGHYRVFKIADIDLAKTPVVDFVEAQTLPLAIALFTKQLYSK